MKLNILKRPHMALLTLLVSLSTTFTSFAQEENLEYPMGPIGARMKLQTDKNFVRVSNVLDGSPALAAGLQVNDFIYGAFGKEFDPLSSTWKGYGGVFAGCVRQLGNAIDRAEHGNGSLPLMIMRPGTGTMTITINLTPAGILTPAHPLTSAKYKVAYDKACDELHQLIMNDNDGDVGYQTGFIGLALLGHPNWNDTTGAKPYRQSLDKIKDLAIARINAAWYAPFEDLLLDLYEADGITHKQPSANANAIPSHESLKNWDLGGLGMFLAEYYTKTQQVNDADPLVFNALQHSAELSANRIQNWKQPPGTNPWGRDPSYEDRRGLTGHSDVTGDYMHYDFGGGINMAGVHLFGALALAKRAGVDMTVKPKDGKHFGYDLSPGDPRPAEIATALPDTVLFPRNGEDSAGYTKMSKTATVPADANELVTDPFYYDWELRQKFWLKWEFLRRSTSSLGYVVYAVGTAGQDDACGRTAGTLFGVMAYTDGIPPTAEDLEIVEKQKSYLAQQHDISLNSHAYNSGGAQFYALAAPYLDDRQQRFYLHNWRFRANFMREHDGSISYFSGREYADAYVNTDHSKLVHIALPRSVATGGLPNIKGFDTNRIFAQFHMPGLSWPTIEARALTQTDSLTVNLNAELIDTSGNVIDPASSSVTWSVISGPATTGIIAAPSSLVTTATFPHAGSYRVQLEATHAGISTTELIDMEVSAHTLPAGWQTGKANYEIYENISGSQVSNLTSSSKFPDSPDISTTISTLDGNHYGDFFGAKLSGYIVAPKTGDYTFYIASDDTSELRFNATASQGDAAADQAGLQSIANVERHTHKYQWDKYAAQTSQLISLVAGERYYFEALHKEEAGSGYVSVAWTLPGLSNIEVITSSHLAIPISAVPATPSIITQPADQTIALGDTATFTLVTEGPELATYQWRLNGVNFGNVSTSPTLTLTNAGGALEGTYDCVYTAGNQVVVSDAATLSFNDAGYGSLISGGLWEEEYFSIKGTQISDLTSSSKYPHLADTSQVISTPEHVSPAADSARRWSGWIVPTETAEYRFFVASDNAHQLWLSQDEFEGHKQLISSDTGSIPSRAWESATPSAWISLVAGERYFVEFLHKNNGSSDHAAITWQKFGDPDPVNGSDPIPSAVLQYRMGGYYNDPATVPALVVDDMFVVNSNEASTLDVLANDLDNDLPNLAVNTFTAPGHGTLNSNASGLIYTPDANYSGTDTFTYTTTNSNGVTSASATVSITVLPNGTLSGGLNYEVFQGISGASIISLTNDAKYPYNPDIVSTITMIESDHDDDNFGAKISGYIIAPTTGDYTFMVAANNSAEFSLNTTASTGVLPIDQAGLATIAYTELYTGYQEWDRYPSQTSSLVTLTAGQAYYFEVLHKESTASSHLSAAWITPGSNRIEAIDSKYFGRPDLSLPTPPPAILVHPVDQSVALGEAVTFSIITQGPRPAIYQWRLNGVNVGTAGDNPTLTIENAQSVAAGTYDCVFTSDGQTFVSNPADLTFTDVGYGTVMTGGLWQDNYHAISGAQITDLTGATNFPYFPSTSGVITTAEKTSPVANSGRHWSGWIVPTETADYRFFVAADDSNELWLSPDEYESHKRLISSRSSYRNSRAWETVIPSEYIHLVAGQRYYIELLHKSNGTSDHAAINWQKSGDPDPVNGDPPISGTYLQYRLGGHHEDLSPVAAIATDDVVHVDQNGISDIAVMLNDLDNDLTSLAIAQHTQPTNGTLTLNGTVFRYQPNRDFSGSDSFTYSTLNSDGLTSNTATVNITIVPHSSSLPTLERGTSSLSTCFQGHEIYNGSSFVNGWGDGGAKSIFEFTLTGNILNYNHTDTSTSWLLGKDASKDGGLTTWNTSNHTAWTFETRLKVNAAPNGYRIILAVDTDRIYLDIYGDKTKSGAGRFTSNHNNADGAYHVWRVAHDKAEGTYHVWRDGERLTPSRGVAYDSTTNDSRLRMGDTSSYNIFNGFNVDIDYVCYDQTAAYLPTGADADGDGITDAWEHLHFGNMTIANPGADDDGDGRSNLEEYQADTDPFDKSSIFTISQFTEPTADNWQLTVPETSSKRTYTLLQSNDLGETAPWTAVPGQTNIPGTDGALIFQFPNSVKKFYRVQANLP